jgi:Pyruvate/2-oxoacid:ferredoxin oxidoreductase gamma subunit
VRPLRRGLPEGLHPPGDGHRPSSGYTPIARDLGALRTKNMVAWGAFQVASRLFPMESFLYALRKALGEGSELAQLNERAFREGMEAAAAALEVTAEETPLTT